MANITNATLAVTEELELASAALPRDSSSNQTESPALNTNLGESGLTTGLTNKFSIQLPPWWVMKLY